MNDFETHPIGTADMIKEMEGMLDTYRSWHYNSRQRIAELEAAMKYTGTELGKAREDNERLRAALEKIAACDSLVDDPAPIAREALR